MTQPALHLSHLCNEVGFDIQLQACCGRFVFRFFFLKFQMSVVTTCKLKIQQDKKSRKCVIPVVSVKIGKGI